MAKVSNGAVMINRGGGINDDVLANLGIAVDHGVGHDDGARGDSDARADLGGGMNDGGEGVALGCKFLGDLSSNCIVADGDDPLTAFGVQVGRRSIGGKDGNTLNVGLP